jgi:dTDP-3-amino-3,4,6-trideoxy-alpha-D-glucose transaminase
VGSGLDALEIALRCLGIGAGDRVLTTPLSSFATTLALTRVGAVPVFTDVDDAGLLDLGRCREALRRDPAIKGLLPVHLYGHAVDLDALAELRREFGLAVVEDCAQAIGAAWRGRPVGSVGDLAATSFYPTKNLGSLGDGGAVLAASAPLAEHARALRDYGRTATSRHQFLGLNSRLDELHAAVLRDALLPRLDALTARRTAVAARYRREIRHPLLRLPEPPAGSTSVWHLFPVRVAPGRRAAFVHHLGAREIDCGLHYPTLIPEQPALAAYGRFAVEGDLPRARDFAGNQVSLPVHPFLTAAEADRVVAACNAWPEG